MKITPTTFLFWCSFAAMFWAPNALAADSGKPIVLSGNFQMAVPIDPNASTADVVNALTQANAALSDMMTRECAVLSDAFKRDCHVAQFNLGSNFSDGSARRFARQLNEDGALAGNANLNVTFELTRRADAAKSPDAN